MDQGEIVIGESEALSLVNKPGEERDGLAHFSLFVKLHGLEGAVIKGEKNLDDFVPPERFPPGFLRARNRDITQAFQFFKSVPIDPFLQLKSFGIGQALDHLTKLLAIAGQFFLPGQIIEFIKIGFQGV